MIDEQLLHYSQHILMHAIGIEGQQRQFDASTLIIGPYGLDSLATPAVKHTADRKRTAISNIAHCASSNCHG